MRDLPDIVAANEPAVPPIAPEQRNWTVDAVSMLTVLRIARNSLEDVLMHGLGSAQRRNIRGTDLPAIRAAIQRIEQEGSR